MDQLSVRSVITIGNSNVYHENTSFTDLVDKQRAEKLMRM
jgi:hypothetical protein